ncbi:MAG: tRNA pseudouridine(38-40) synthase TruA [Lachnospiraceae bacterium]|nr:tRNA pseudouridine(38-40) synthase TruA [Lachnospiraceae bacterium]
MRRILLEIAYDGTDYCGWQIQPDAPTIEGILNRELSRLLNEEIKVIGASRTDAGVHAEGAVAVFDTSSNIPGEKFSYAINQSLPDDIVVRRSEETDARFHPRKVNCRKTYRYSIWHDKFPMPLISRYAHWVHYPLDIEAMKTAAAYFVGEHDFAGFCSASADVDSTVRTIYEMRLENSGEVMHDLTREFYKKIDIYVTGNGFLYNMVRIIAGTLIDVGTGKILPSDIPEIIASADRTRAGNTAPANGLTLVGYEFEKQ